MNERKTEHGTQLKAIDFGKDKSISDMANLETQRLPTTKLDNPLSFGMARLLGDVKKNCGSGKPFYVRFSITSLLFEGY